MKKNIFYLPFLLLFITIFIADAQDKPASKKYWMSASEFIFSGGDVKATGGPGLGNIIINPIVRFSGFFHFQEQYHVNFNNNFGIYTGVGMRNVGMINELNDSIKIKQRVYSLGVPFAFKFGKLSRGFSVALGGEVEFFFHYKQKVFYDDEKFRQSEWLSDKVNLINPSVFLDLHAGKGTYIRFKYYLLDFLRENKQNIKLNGISYAYFPHESKMFYVSLGTTIRSFASKRSRKKASPPVNTTLL